MPHLFSHFCISQELSRVRIGKDSDGWSRAHSASVYCLWCFFWSRLQGYLLDENLALHSGSHSGSRWMSESDSLSQNLTWLICTIRHTSRICDLLLSAHQINSSSLLFKKNNLFVNLVSYYWGSVLRALLFSLHIKSLCSVNHSHGCCHHCYAGDTSFHSHNFSLAETQVAVWTSACLADMSKWMSVHSTSTRLSRSPFLEQHLPSTTSQ